MEKQDLEIINLNPMLRRQCMQTSFLWGELCLFHFTMLHFFHVYQDVEHQVATASAHKLKCAVCAQWQYWEVKILW